jgi:hypothetical protein
MAFSLLCLGLMPSGLRVNPRYETSLLPKKHLSKLILRWFVLAIFRIWSSTLRWSLWFWVWMNRLSIQTMPLLIGLSTDSMSHWKLTGQPISPIGNMIQWHWPFTGMIKAVCCCESGSSCICQNPILRSKGETIVEFAHPMSSIHSIIFFHGVFVNERINDCLVYKSLAQLTNLGLGSLAHRIWVSCVKNWHI